MVQYTDSFTNSDGTALSTHDVKWVKRTAAVADFQIVSNAVSTKTGATKVSYWNDVTADAQGSQGTIAQIPAGVDIWIGVAVRIQTADALNFYGFWSRNSEYSYMFRCVAGAFTHLGTDGAGYPVSSILKLEASGTTLTPFLNGSTATPPGAITDSTFATGYTGICGYGNATGDVLLDAWTGGDLVSTQTLSHLPEEILASTNLAGDIESLRDDPDAPDAFWLTAVSASAATDLRVSFTTPVGNPYGAQFFYCLLRKTTGAANPTVTIELRQDDSLSATLNTAIPISSTTGQVLQANWTEGNLVTCFDGHDVECRIVSVPGAASSPGATPAYSSTGQAAADATATITTAITPAKPSTVNSGDLLILHVLARNDNSDGAGPATIANWTAFAGNPYGGTNHARTSLYWRIAGAGEASQTVSVSCTGSTTNDLAMARIYRFTAANGFAATPIVGVTSRAGEVDPMQAPVAIYATGSNQLAVCVSSIASSDGAIGNLIEMAGGTWADVAVANVTTGGDGTLNLQTSSQTTGTTMEGGRVSFTVTTSPCWVTVGFMLVPAELGGGTANTVEVGAIEWLETHVAIADVETNVGALLGGVPNMMGTNYSRTRTW